MIIAQTVPPLNIVSSYTPKKAFSFYNEGKKILANGIQYTFFSTQLNQPKTETQLYKLDTRDFLQNMESHIDYPEISVVAKSFANQICKDVFDLKNIKPTRTANSVEGGVAIIYSRKEGVLRKKYKEVFIECYNDNTAIVSLTENYKLKKINEVPIENPEIIFNYIAEIYKS